MVTEQEKMERTIPELSELVRKKKNKQIKVRKMYPGLSLQRVHFPLQI